MVDDQSADRTSEILKDLEAQFTCLHSLRIDSLPKGWKGKTYALATAAGQTSGEWLLFTDADTKHRPGSLATLLKVAEEKRADLLSLSPGQETPTWWEKAVIPFVYVRLSKLYRFEEVSDPASPAAAANGQFLLIRRDIYQRVGGHEAVRDALLEDVELARRVKAAGGRLVFLPGAPWVRTRMYATFREMWRGWTKNLYLLYGADLGRIVVGCGKTFTLDVLPAPAFLALCLWFAAGRGGAAMALAAVALFLLALLRQWSYGRALGRLGFGARLAAYQIPGALLFGLMLLNSAWAYRVARRVEWKGREYSTTTSADGGKV